MSVLVFAKHDGDNLDAHAMSSIVGSVPQALIALGHTMLEAEKQANS